MKNKTAHHTYWAIISRQFRKNRMALWSSRILIFLFLIALFADFIANEKPIYCKVEGQTYFPIFKNYLVQTGVSKPHAIFLNKDWKDIPYESVVFPLIPYSPSTLDQRNKYKGPFAEQQLAAGQSKHYLGTAVLGKDVAAIMVHGVRIALVVGIVSMLIASLIGILLGGLAGYFGDEELRISRGRLWLNIMGLFFAFYYGFVVRAYALSEASQEGYFMASFLKSVGIFILIMIVGNSIASLLKRIPFFTKKRSIPVDIIVMRLAEIFNSIPGLLFLLAVIAIVEQSTIFIVMLVIGVLRWTSIARFVRAELLRIRALGYISAAKSMGLSDVRILLRHALPNAIGPVLITIAFGIASAILLEAGLSFLGIGLGANEMTWGKLLSYARTKPSAWWLAVFPGLAIFVTVMIFNWIGEGLSDAISPREQQ